MLTLSPPLPARLTFNLFASLSAIGFLPFGADVVAPRTADWRQALAPWVDQGEAGPNMAEQHTDGHGPLVGLFDQGCLNSRCLGMSRAGCESNKAESIVFVFQAR